VTRAPTIELLWWEGCPSYPDAIEQLRQVLREEELDPEAFDMRQVETDEQAQAERFPGSPTIRIDGRDPVPPPDGEPFTLTCRVYRLRDGRYSPLPDPADLKDALRRAKEDA
jgi:hypothetical protein